MRRTSSGRREILAVAHQERFACRGRMIERAHDRIDEVADEDEAPAIPHRAERQRHAAGDERDEPREIAARAGAVDERRAEDHRLEAARSAERSEAALGVRLGSAVRILRQERARLGERRTRGAITVHPCRAEEHESPDSRGRRGFRKPQRTERVHRAVDAHARRPTNRAARARARRDARPRRRRRAPRASRCRGRCRPRSRSRLPPAALADAPPDRSTHRPAVGEEPADEGAPDEAGRAGDEDSGSAQGGGRRSRSRAILGGSRDPRASPRRPQADRGRMPVNQRHLPETP